MTAVTLRAGEVVRGERGGEYRILEWRGEGSYARVYRAQLLPAPVGNSTRRNGRRGESLPLRAVKLAKIEIPGARERLERERTVGARVRHARIVPLLDAGQWEEAPFVVRGWVEGPDLRRLVERQRRLPLVQALAYLHDLAGAVAALHAAGLAHGDLRPENVLVEESTRHAILADVGEAPVRTEGAFAAQRRADTAALGGMLALMLTGEQPDSSFGRLSMANGYNPDAVRLWEDARAGRLSPAALQREVAALLQSIGGRGRR